MIDRATAKNVKWGVKVCRRLLLHAFRGRGKGVRRRGRSRKTGFSTALDAATGKLLWQWKAPARKIPHVINDFVRSVSAASRPSSGCARRPPSIGDRVYFVSNRFEVVCLDAQGRPREAAGRQARVAWSFDMWDRLGVFPCDAANGSPLIDGDLLYVPTSNGVDRKHSATRPGRRTARSRPAVRRT